MEPAVNGYEPVIPAADAVVLGITRSSSGNYRKRDRQDLRVLLTRRSQEPFAGCCCLPGSFIRADETPEAAVHRTLKEKAGLEGLYIEQLYTFGDIGRDPRMRVISIAYIALTYSTGLQESEDSGVCWCTLEEIDRLPMAFDHRRIIHEAVKRLRGKLNYTDIVFHLLPEEFTIGEAQEIYEIILGEKLLPAAFRRTIEPKLEFTGKMTSNEGHRPSRIYRLKSSGEEA